jgi:hypothetical protein
VQDSVVAAEDSAVKLKMTVVGTADMIIDLPSGSEETVHAIEYDLPRDFEGFLADLGINNIGEVDFLNQLRSLEEDKSSMVFGERCRRRLSWSTTSFSRR